MPINRHLFFSFFTHFVLVLNNDNDDRASLMDGRPSQKISIKIKKTREKITCRNYSFFVLFLYIIINRDTVFIFILRLFFYCTIKKIQYLKQLVFKTHLSCHHNQRYISDCGFVECLWICYIYAVIRCPFTHFHKMLFLQFEQINFKIIAFPFFEFYSSC